MSRDAESNMPPKLRKALEERASADKASERSPDPDELWKILGRAEPSDASLPDADETWAGVRRQIDAQGDDEDDRRADDRRPSRSGSRTSSTRRRLWRWGGAVATLLVLVVAMWWWSQPIELTATAGTTVSHVLPDGSTVELNSDTRLTYSRFFSAPSVLEADRRLVQLDGEAYFEVEAGGRPFVVQTPTAHVEVRGTAFSVRSRDDEEHETQVALAEGQVRVEGRASVDAERTLRPGQAVTVGGDGRISAVRDTSIDRVLAWRRGGFAVTAKPLPALATALERRFGTSIRLDPSIPTTTRSDPLTLYYSQSVDLETILHDVCMARGLTYRATANGYILSAREASQVRKE